MKKNFKKNVLKSLLTLVLFLFIAAPAFAVATNIYQNGEQLFRFDPQWQGNGENPFIPRADGFSLSVKIGSASRMVFPKILDFKTPIVINTRYGAVQQFLQGSRRDELFQNQEERQP